MKGAMQLFLPERRLVDKVRMHVDYPQEEDIALGNEAGFSFYYWFYFPNDHQRITDEFLALSPGVKGNYRKYKRRYKRFIKRCILNIGGDQYIAKNPPNLARIPFLLDIFPQSRFVYIRRNPYEVILSAYRFFKGFLKTLQLQDIDDETLWDFIFRTYIFLYNKYREDRHLISPRNLAELKYEELIANPERIFRSLQEGIFSDLKTDESKLNSIIRRHRDHSANAYKFDRDYIDRVNSELGDLIEEQGYKKLS
jgi:hypothetical protein